MITEDKTQNKRISFLLPIATLWVRELVRFYRDRNRMIGAFGQPVLFWIFIGSGFGASFHSSSLPEDVTYIEYFYPGTLLLILLFTAIFSTISIVEDRREGFLQSVLVSPISRSSLVLGKISGGATMALFQGILFLALSFTVGISTTPASFIYTVGTIFLIAFGMTGLGFSIAWCMDSTAGFHAIMNLFLIPLWLLSGAVFPISGVPSWLQVVMWLNPVTYGMAALRHCLYLGHPTGALPSLFLSLTITILFAMTTFVTSLIMVKRRITGGTSTGRSLNKSLKKNTRQIFKPKEDIHHATDCLDRGC